MAASSSTSSSSSSLSPLIDLIPVFSVDEKCPQSEQSKSSAGSKIVGLEMDGVLLVARAGEFDQGMKSVIELYDINEHRFRLLHANKGTFTVHASIDPTRKILAFTTFVKVEKQQFHHQSFFESVVVLLQEDAFSKAPCIFYCRSKGMTNQRIQFLSCKQDKKIAAVFLFFTEDRIDLIKLKKKKEGYKTTTIATLVSNVIWSDWDPLHSCLHTLSAVHSKGETETESTCILRCHVFEDALHPEMDIAGYRELPINLPLYDGLLCPSFYHFSVCSPTNTSFSHPKMTPSSPVLSSPASATKTTTATTASINIAAPKHGLDDHRVASPVLAATFHGTSTMAKMMMEISLDHDDLGACSPRDTNFAEAEEALSTKTSRSPTKSSGNSNNRRHSLSHVRVQQAYISVVKMRAGAVCLCVQHPTAVTMNNSSKVISSAALAALLSPQQVQYSIRVTIYILHQNTQFDIWIPVGSEKMDQAVVFFGSIGDALLVMLPGVFIQLVDCGPLHEALEGFSITKSEFPHLFPLFPGHHESAMVLVPLDLLPTTNDKLLIPDLQGHSMLDLEKGVVYSYNITRKGLSEYLLSPLSTLYFPQALHFTLVHLQDTALIESVVISLLKSDPSRLACAALKELLRGLAFQSLRAKSLFSDQFLLLIPCFAMTPLPRIAVSPVKDLHINPRRVSVEPRRSSGSLLDILQASPKQVVQKFSAPHSFNPALSSANPGSPIPMKRNSSSLSSSSSTSISRTSSDRLTNLINASSTTGWSSYGSGSSSPAPELGDGKIAALRKAAVESFAEQLQHTMKEGKHRSLELAVDIQDQQLLSVSRVFKWINVASIPSRLELFRVMEQLYCAVEDLYLWLPKGFSSQFAALGLACLPRHVFCQYVDRGVFRLDESLIRKVTSALGNSSEDVLFKFELISQLKVEESIPIMMNHHENTQYLLEFLMATSPEANNIETGDSVTIEEMEKLSEIASFMPVSVLVSAINKQWTGERYPAASNTLHPYLQYINSNASWLSQIDLQ